MNTTDYSNKKILILGLGLNKGGLGAAKFFAQKGATVKVTDLKTKEELSEPLAELEQFKDIEYVLGQHRNEDIDWADIVIRNPALKPGNPYRLYAEKTGKAQTDVTIFLQFVKPEQIIGITGTKGKSTTSSLIYEILKSTDKKVLFAGNIGKSVLETIEFVDEQTLVVLEISSFQLEGFDQLKVSPKWALITNIMPDHLNYYSSMEQYIEAKRVIAKYQSPTDFLFINKDDQNLNNPAFLDGLEGKLTYFSPEDLPTDFQPTLPGEHNLSNYAGALQVAKTFGLNEKDALATANKFNGVEFRQQLIKTWNGIKIINDTAATGPDAAIAALNTYPNSILIAGGQNANLGYDELAKMIDQNAKDAFFLEGDVTEELKKLITKKELIKGTYNNFESLLADVIKTAKTGDTILFSPGAKSFNLFQNEFDRGRKFNAAVEKIFQ